MNSIVVLAVAFGGQNDVNDTDALIELGRSDIGSILERYRACSTGRSGVSFIILLI